MGITAGSVAAELPSMGSSAWVGAQRYLWCVSWVAKSCVCTLVKVTGLGWFIAMVPISRDNWIYWKCIIKDLAKIWWLQSWSGLLFEFHPRNHNVVVTAPVFCCIWKSCRERRPLSVILVWMLSWWVVGWAMTHGGVVITQMSCGHQTWGHARVTSVQESFCLRYSWSERCYLLWDSVWGYQRKTMEANAAFRSTQALIQAGTVQAVRVIWL